tara:strand:- start:168 stop:1142 length:975 start_codon:yes stop_codon:yes gene_type:complete
MAKKKTLVFGGAGYIGSHIVADLCDLGKDVIVYDNLLTGFKDNIHSNALFVEGDILDRDQVNEVCSLGIDSIFHFAALKAAGQSMVYPSPFSDVNISGSINILNAAVKHSVKNIIFSSSALVYGHPRYSPIDEDHIVSPVNFYGFTKSTIEEIIKWYAKIFDINYAILRYFNAAGYDIKGRISKIEKNTANLLPVIMEVAIGSRDCLDIFGNDWDTKDGTCIRDYIHVNDLSNAHIKSLSSLEIDKQNIVLNLATGIGYSVKEVLLASEDVLGMNINHRYVERRLGDPKELVAKTINAYNLLNWSPEYSDISTIIKSMWEVYKK